MLGFPIAERNDGGIFPMAASFTVYLQHQGLGFFTHFHIIIIIIFFFSSFTCYDVTLQISSQSLKFILKHYI